MVKCNMNFWKKATLKPYITLFTRITKKRHGQILNEPLQKTMFQTTRHTFDKQPDSTTNTGHNKYYDETNPIMKLTNIVRIHGASYRPTSLNIATSAAMFLVIPGIW